MSIWDMVEDAVGTVTDVVALPFDVVDFIDKEIMGGDGLDESGKKPSDVLRDMTREGIDEIKG